MDPAALSIFALALLVAAATPGPGIAAVVAQALGRGRSGAVAFSLGLALGDIVWLTVAILGLAALAQTFHLAFLVLKWLGVAYLAYLAWQMVNSEPQAGTGAEQVASSSASSRPAGVMLAGLAVTLSNPKTMIFYLALLPTLLNLGQVTLLGYAELVGVTAAVLGLVLTFYVYLALRARRLLTSGMAMSRVNRAAGLAIAGAAGWIASR
jgi:threonine/homoserine/homoserine lactone efflux protein